jgi:acetoin utilization protein AcuB
MLVRDWMRPNPMTVPSDTLVSEAKRLLTEHKLVGLPVVDGGRLRGLLTPAHCLRASHFVTRTQDPDELAYFETRLKVKDIMVRNPGTIDASDTIEHCVMKGRQLGVSQFPVLEEGRLVGIISANEIFSLCTWLLGAWAAQSGITVGPLRLQTGVLRGIVDVAESAGAVLQAVYPQGKNGARGERGMPDQRVVIRFHAPDVRAVSGALERAGFQVLESVEAPSVRVASPGGDDRKMGRA